MNIGEKQRNRCGDGITRTGTVTYIHPKEIFYNLKFSFPLGSFEESFLTGQEDDAKKSQKAKRENLYTPEQDKQILKVKDLHGLAKKFGRSVDALYQRRRRLKMEGGKAK